MNKRIIILIIISLIFLVATFGNRFRQFTKPDRILLVGYQVSESVTEYKKEIKDQNKITEFEELFDKVHFSNGEIVEDRYPDFVVQIMHMNEGYSTHYFSIWIDGDEGFAMINSDEKLIGRLSSYQMNILSSIIN